jgi:hypothetical protein
MHDDYTKAGCIVAVRRALTQGNGDDALATFRQAGTSSPPARCGTMVQ